MGTKKQHRGLRAKTLMQGLGTRLERNSMVAQWIRTSYLKVSSARFSHCAIATTCVSMVRLWFLGVGTEGYFLPLPGPTWSFSTST